MSDVTVKDLDDLVFQMRVQRADIAKKEAELSELNKRLGALEQKAVAYLQALKRTSYKTPDGLIFTQDIWQTKLPATQRDKDALFAWMRERKIYDKYATIHAKSLNTLFVAERAAAIERGEDPVTFALPGMEPATVFKKLKLRKG